MFKKSLRPRTLTAAVAAVLCLMPLAAASALQNDPPPYVARIVFCGQYDRAWFLAHRDPQWGDTLNDQLTRAAKARCTWLGGLLPLSSPGNTVFGKAIGLFSDGLNHNDPYNNGNFDGVDANGNTTYTLTGAKFACGEFEQGTVGTVAPSVSCPPFSTDIPGGNAGGTGGAPWQNWGVLDAAMDDAVLTSAGGLGGTGLGGIYAGYAHDFVRLGVDALNDPEGTVDDALTLFAKASEVLDDAIRNDPTNAWALDQSALALVSQARLIDETSSRQLLAEAELRLLVNEENSPGSAAYNLGCVRALDNDEEGARGWLETARDRGTLPSVEHMESDSDLDSVRHTGWFQDLLAAAGGEG